MTSVELEQLANSEENDLKALGLYTKALREKRDERFHEYLNKLVSLGYKIKYYEIQSRRQS